jgi:hypothetical protein
METKERTPFVEPTKANIEATIEKIKQYALDKGYQFKGDVKKEGLLNKAMSFFSNSEIKFESKSQSKVCRDYLTRLDRKMGMSLANRFLHFLYKKVYKSTDAAPFIEYSEKELKIKQSRKEWKKLQAEAEKMLAAYKQEKGDYYKKK